MKISAKFFYLFLLPLLLFSCSEETNFIPKEPAYLRIDFPKRAYHSIDDSCPYTFELPQYMKVQPVSGEMSSTCNKDINLGQFNGIILFSHLNIDTALSFYINHSIQRVQEHQIMASSISDTAFLIPEHKVYGAFFEIKGNAASPFQFFLTDSVNHFVKAEVFFNAVPNYDSIYPVLQYIKPDLYHLIETLEWK